MKILDTKHKRKSAIITAIIMLLLLFAVLKLGMKYLDPPIEYGVAINFGNSEVGSGEPVENVKKSEPVQEEVVEEKTEVQETLEEPIEEVQEEPIEEVIKEEVITNETSEEVPVIKKEEPKKTPKKEPVKEVPKKVEKPVEKPKPKKPSKAATDALNNLLNGNSSEGSTKGEGDDNEAGVKGKENGDPNSNKYYGNSGSGSGGNYNLAGRKALSKPVKQPDCEEEGTVVVSIEVDKNGKVIKAIPGVRGTTNSAPCLLEPAKRAALATRWNADGDAPVKQKGTIIYKFSLSQ